MQIHELTEFQGMPSSGDFLAIDDGERTRKIEAENLGVTTAMTTAEAEAGTSTAKRVMTPKMFHDYVEDNTAKGFVELTQAEYDELTQEEKNDGRVFFITDGMPTPSPYILACYPVGSYYETSDANFDPSTEWGGTWTLVSSKDAYVVEEGTDGIWTYRKWSDGIAECWGIHSVSSSAWTAWGNGYYTSTYSQPTFPTGLFLEAPVVSALNQSGLDAYITHSGTVTKNAVGSIFLTRPTSSPEAGYSIGYMAKGKWSNTSETYYRWHRTA